MARLIALLSFLVFASLASAAHAQEGPKQIGIVLDGPAPRSKALLDLAKKELEGLMGGADAVRFSEDKIRTGDFTLAAAKGHVQALLADDEVDLIWAFGPLASNAAVRIRPLAKPVIAPFIFDEKLQGIARDKAPETLSYVLWAPRVERDLKALQDFGDFEHVAVLANAHYLKALPKLGDQAKVEGKKLGMRISVVPAGADVAATLAAIPKDADAVYLRATLHWTTDDVAKLAQGLIERKLPSVSSIGQLEVQRGILLGLGGPDDARRLTRRVAINTQALLRGEPASELTRAFKLEERLVVNMATARAIGLSLSWEVLADAELLHAKSKKAVRKLSLQRVIREALARNIDLQVYEQNVLAGDHGVDEARASLLPRLEASLSGSWIDADRAGLGQAERGMSWSSTLSQSVFDEKSWSNFTVQKYLRDSRKHDAAAAELDTIQAAANAYLNVLRAQTTERIRRDNLKTTRELLALARVRLKVGTGQQSEVLRWESSLASARGDLVTAVAQRNLMEIDLNRLLNRPLEEPFNLVETSLEQSSLWEGGKRWGRSLQSPARFKRTRTFLAHEAVRQAPELRSLDASAAAKDREVTSNTLAPFLPSFSLQASVTHNFLKGGEGSDSTSTIPGMTEQDNFNWQLGATATLPLYEGNLRYARKRRNQAELRQLELQRQSRRQVVEQNVRVALHQAGATYRAIRWTKDSARSAEQSLALVTDSYGKGKADIAELIDAQNQALVAELSATSAAYDFLLDMMAVERAMGRFGFMMSERDISAFHRRMDAYVSRGEQR